MPTSIRPRKQPGKRFSGPASAYLRGRRSLSSTLGRVGSDWDNVFNALCLNTVFHAEMIEYD